MPAVVVLALAPLQYLLFQEDDSWNLSFANETCSTFSVGLLKCGTVKISENFICQKRVQLSIRLVSVSFRGLAWLSESMDATGLTSFFIYQ